MDLVASFYSLLFEQRPDLKHMFPSDLMLQRHKFAMQMSAISEGLDDWPAMIGQIEALGRRHRRFGVEAEHYRVVEDCVVDALRDTLQDDFNEECGLAWHALLKTVSSIMIDAAEYGSCAQVDDPNPNPLAPIMGVTISQFAVIVRTMRDETGGVVSNDALASLDLDWQTWETIRIGWNDRLHDPKFGSVVAAEYVRAYSETEI